jgi:hypothetical protein
MELASLYRYQNRLTWQSPLRLRVRREIVELLSLLDVQVLESRWNVTVEVLDGQ